MVYTVKRVIEMWGVSVRTLHFHDETGLLKTARRRANGYKVLQVGLHERQGRKDYHYVPTSRQDGGILPRVMQV
jgi:MerR family regulatory protein